MIRIGREKTKKVTAGVIACLVMGMSLSGCGFTEKIVIGEDDKTESQVQDETVTTTAARIGTTAARIGAAAAAETAAADEEEADAVHSVSGECGDNVTWQFDESGVLTISGTGAMTDFGFDFDAEVADTPWFDERDDIKVIVIEDGITSIGDHAFEHISGIINVNIPNSVKSIGDGAFGTCTALTSVSVPDGVTSLGDSVFWGCTALKSVSFPDTLKSIGEGTFVNCDELKSVSIPKSVDEIGYSAFGCSFEDTDGGTFYVNSDFKIYCYEGTAAEEYAKENFEYELLGKDSKIEEGECGNNVRWKLEDSGILTISGSGAMTDFGFDYDTETADTPWFKKRDSIKAVVIEDGITSVGDHAFEHLSGIISVNVPHSVERIGIGAFGTCTSLTNVSLTNGLLTIDESAFWGCTSLKSINIPNSVTSVESAAFVNCSDLKSVTVPKSVTYIGSQAFGFTDLGQEGDYYTDPNFRLYCYGVSAGEEYAVNNGITYRLII